MESTFTKMLKGETPCVLLCQDNDHAAILEPRPLLPGHTVVFPKRVIDAFFDLDPTALARLMQFSQLIARALKAEIPCQKIAVLIYGLQTPHAHIHLIPVQGDPGELNLTKLRPTTNPTDLEALAARLRPYLPRPN